MALDKQKIVFISLSAILLIAAIIMGVLLMDSRKQNEEMQELFAIEKEELWDNETGAYTVHFNHASNIP